MSARNHPDLAGPWGRRRGEEKTHVRDEHINIAKLDIYRLIEAVWRKDQGNTGRRVCATSMRYKIADVARVPINSRDFITGQGSCSSAGRQRASLGDENVAMKAEI